MSTKTTLSRMTIDLPKEDHKRLKAIAAILGKSMRELVLEAVEKYLEATQPTKNLRTLSKKLDSRPKE